MIEIPAQGGPVVEHLMSEVMEVEVFHVAQRVNVKASSLIAPVADQVVSQKVPRKGTSREDV